MYTCPKKRKKHAQCTPSYRTFPTKLGFSYKMSMMSAMSNIYNSKIITIVAWPRHKMLI